jgi:hypothetical protein
MQSLPISGESIPPGASLYRRGQPQIVSGLTFQPITVEQLSGVAGRVFDTYRPLLSTARLSEDQTFEEQLQPKLVQATFELKEAQSSEADGLVLQAVIEVVWELGAPEFRNIKFSELSKRIRENHRVPLSPRQIGPIARELGLTTKISHGATVVVPTPATVLKACEECDYSDEGIEELRLEMRATQE